jgi:hypothetical protein
VPSLETLEPPVQYSQVNTSNKSHPKGPRLDISQPAVGPSGDRHQLDQKITITMAIQQLYQLTTGGLWGRLPEHTKRQIPGG